MPYPVTTFRLFGYNVGIHLLEGEPLRRSTEINPRDDHMSFQVNFLYCIVTCVCVPACGPDCVSRACFCVCMSMCLGGKSWNILPS